MGGEFHLFVGEQALDEFGAGVGFGFVVFRLRLRQQQAGFDFYQHGGHQEVFGGEVKLVGFHLVDVAEVLLGDLQHGDVQHV